MDDYELRVAQLSASLSLVRPVGMTEGETMDWLAVAVDATSDIPFDIFEKGCRTARKRCTHHSQIVPAIVEETREDIAWRNRPPSPVLRLVAPETAPALTQQKVDPNKISTDLQRIGLAAGWIVEIAPPAEGIPAIYAWAEDSAA